MSRYDKYNFLSLTRSSVAKGAGALKLRDGTGKDFLDPTRPVNFKIIAGRPVSDRPGRPFFFTECFCSLLNVSNEKFAKGGGGDMGKVLKFVILEGGLRKLNAKNFFFLCKNYSILRPFLFKFRFGRPFLSSAKRAQNKHKNHWRAQAKLLYFLSNDIMRRPKM